MMNLLAPGEAIGPNSSAPEPVEAAPSLNEYGTTPSGAIVQPFRLPADTTVVAACAPPAITSATHAAANAPATLNFIPKHSPLPRSGRTPDGSYSRSELTSFSRKATATRATQGGASRGT